MRKLILALGTGLFVVSCNTGPTKELPKNSDLIQQNLKGKVQHLEESPWLPDSSGKTGALDTCCTGFTEFDEQGYMTKYFTKDNKGTIREEQTFTRFDKGQMKEILTLNKGKKKSSMSIQVDSAGKYSGGQTFDSVGKMTGYYTDLKENEYGIVTDGKYHKPDSSVKMTFTAMFDKGIYLGGSSSDSTGKVVSTTRVKVNDKGDQIEITNINVKKDSTTTEVTSYKYENYDEQGNWLQQTAINDKGKPTKIITRIITYYKKE